MGVPLMAVLRYWDAGSSQWRAVQAPTLSVANGIWQGRSSGTLTLTTNAVVAITGCSVSVPVVSTSERFMVIGQFDLSNNSTTSATVPAMLYVDGVAVSGQAVFCGSTVNSIRSTSSQTWMVTGLSPGNHTFDLRAQNFSNTGSVQLLATNTEITVVSLGGPPLSPAGGSVPGPWTALPLVAGYVEYSAAQTPQYRLEPNNMVQLRGWVKPASGNFSGGTVNFATLPAEARPARPFIGYAGVHGDVTAAIMRSLTIRLEITGSTGAISTKTSSSPAYDPWSWVSLDGWFYSLDA
jgi:hypothetical protein